MVSVWKVVVATMLGTALIGFAWHSMGMAKVRMENTHNSNEVRASIAKLTLYRDTLTSTSTKLTK